MSRREQILAALAAVLAGQLAAPVRRNEVLPEKVPAAGLVILRDGEPVEPDITLNPRTEFYAHRVELEVYVPRDPSGGGEAALDQLLGALDVHAVLVLLFHPHLRAAGAAAQTLVLGPVLRLEELHARNRFQDLPR